MVALVFAEAASHYPLAGGVYQWAKRFMGGTYGWFVAWMFAAALLVTVAAVAFGVAPIVCSLLGWDATNTHDAALDRRAPSPLGPMLLNIYSVKVTAFFNNIGTVTEIIGLVVIAIALYVAVIFGHGDHQSLSVLFDTRRAPARALLGLRRPLPRRRCSPAPGCCTASTRPAGSPRRR